MIDEKVFIPLNELVVLPGRHGAALCRVLGEHIEPFEQLDFGFSDRHVLGGNRWLVAIKSSKHSDPLWEDVDSDRGEEYFFIYRASIGKDGTLNKYPDIKLPAYLLNQTLAIKGDIVYLGGFEFRKEGKRDKVRVNQGEMAGFMDLSLENPKWHSLPLPIEMQAGKSIDDILVYEDKLVLVDNIMYPKYLFEYDISNPMNPVSTKTIDLPNNGTYEHIRRGSINSNWMALLSGGVGRAGSSEYVSVFSLPGYEQVFTVSLLHSADRIMDRTSFTTLHEELEEARNTVKLYDFAIAGNRLLIACGHHGVAVFELQRFLENYRENQREDEKERMYKISGRSYGGSYYSLASIYSDEDCLRKIEGMEEVHRLLPQPDGRVIAVSYGETNLKLEYKVLTL